MNLIAYTYFALLIFASSSLYAVLAAGNDQLIPSATYRRTYNYDTGLFELSISGTGAGARQAFAASEENLVRNISTFVRDAPANLQILTEDGPVMTREPVKIYIIFYGNFSKLQRDRIENYVTHLTSPSTTPDRWSIMTSYYDNKNNYVNRKLILAGSTIDNFSRGRNISTAYNTEGWDVNGVKPLGSVEKSDIAQIILSHVGRGKEFPYDTQAVYFVLTSPEVLIWDYDPIKDDISYGGYHSTFATIFEGKYILFNQGFAHSIGALKSSVDLNATPNGDTGSRAVDRIIHTMHHEIVEAVSDPIPTLAWADYRPNGAYGMGENADMCEFVEFFRGIRFTKEGRYYNTIINGLPYVLPEVWAYDIGGSQTCMAERETSLEDLEFQPPRLANNIVVARDNKPFNPFAPQTNETIEDGSDDVTPNASLILSILPDPAAIIPSEDFTPTTTSTTGYKGTNYIPCRAFYITRHHVGYTTPSLRTCVIFYNGLDTDSEFQQQAVVPIERNFQVLSYDYAAYEWKRPQDVDESQARRVYKDEKLRREETVFAVVQDSYAWGRQPNGKLIPVNQGDIFVCRARVEGAWRVGEARRGGVGCDVIVGNRLFTVGKGDATVSYLSARRGFASASTKTEAVIVAAARTPVGSFQKSLAKFTAPQLGSVAIRGALEKSGLKPSDVEEVLMGNVISAAVGQAPARQAALGAGLPESTEATTINKVCASGMKAVMFGAMSIESGYRKCVVAGGMEKYGHPAALDGIIKDGLWDVYNQIHMGTCAEETAKEYGITREMQDAHAMESYTRSAEAWKKGWYKEEVVPVTIKDKRGDKIISVDEEFTNVKFDKIPTLNPVFMKNGTVTAANASTLNDGASALILMSRAEAEAKGLTPLARIVSYADAATSPKKFTIAPSLAIPIALKKAGLGIQDVSLFEINEAFSVVVRANEKILGLDPSKVNIGGGGVSLGHPIGSSGSRILVSLVHLLKKGQVGVAGICNGGGAASSMVIERL
ncbi:erg10, acetyl-CoA C-acetyltransferase [Chytridiales sp. JEL 0842]|nr:erg10, acetyl-CoA C-acetyltransferase [Chytridiales sp. JEL 0842]